MVEVLVVWKGMGQESKKWERRGYLERLEISKALRSQSG
jgi:hypothetical protein